MNQRAALRGEVAGLADDRVARGDGGNNLAERNRQWIVPGTDDGDYAERFVDDFAGFGFRGQSMVRDAFIAQQRRRLLGVIGGGVQRDENVGEECFDAGLTGFENYSVGEAVV